MSVREDVLLRRVDRGAHEPGDPLGENGAAPDRVSYATGTLLDAEDFSAEQNYHRGRLARALAYLHGSGTVAGLKVNYEPPAETGSAADLREELVVEPGVGLDRLGRIIEVPRAACIRLAPWYAGQDPDKLRQAFFEGVEIPAHQENGAEVAAHNVNGVVADIFVRFAVCERGKTPAFAAGPFDALDAVQPSRLRDGYKLKLFPRTERPLPVPEQIWPTDRAAVQRQIFEVWRRATARDEQNRLEPLREHLAGQDTTYVFLARVILPTNNLDELDEAGRPVRTVERVEIINEMRPFVYSAAALARIAGL